KRSRHDTDDRVHVATQWNCFAEDLCVAVELLHPQFVTQYNDKGPTILVVVRGDIATSFWFDPKSVEEPTSNLSNLKLNRFTAGGVSKRLRYDASEFEQRLSLSFDVS